MCIRYPHVPPRVPQGSRADRLERALEERERKSAEALAKGDERAHELSGLTEILQRSLAQVSRFGLYKIFPSRILYGVWYT